ncbi:MAG: hypothetical protein ACLUGQ_09095 [Coprococcus sp.]
MDNIKVEQEKPAVPVKKKKKKVKNKKVEGKGSRVKTASTA